MFSNIENIFATRQVTEAQNPRSKVPKVAPKPAQNLQNLKSSVGIDPKPLLFVKTVLDAAADVKNIKNIFGFEVYKVKGCGKLVYS